MQWETYILLVLHRVDESVNLSGNQQNNAKSILSKREQTNKIISKTSQETSKQNLQSSTWSHFHSKYQQCQRLPRQWSLRPRSEWSTRCWSHWPWPTRWPNESPCPIRAVWRQWRWARHREPGSKQTQKLARWRNSVPRSQANQSRVIEVVTNGFYGFSRMAMVSW